MKMDLKDKIRELQLRKLKQSQSTLAKGDAEVPCKKKSKPLGYKMQNTFEKNLRGLPGGTGEMGIRKMVDAPRTGTKIRKESIGLLRSARNANTTQGNYTRSIVVDEIGDVVSNAQGRVR